MPIFMELFAELRKKNILLVDDDEWVRDSLLIFFESRGCRLKAVETAEAGMTEISKQFYDIMIIDYQLPGMSGLEFLCRMQNRYPEIPAILISAYGNYEIYNQANAIGVNNIIEKPFNTGTLKASLERIVREEKGRLYNDEGPGEMV